MPDILSGSCWGRLQSPIFPTFKPFDSSFVKVHNFRHSSSWMHQTLKMTTGWKLSSWQDMVGRWKVLPGILHRESACLSTPLSMLGSYDEDWEEIPGICSTSAARNTLTEKLIFINAQKLLSRTKVQSLGIAGTLLQLFEYVHNTVTNLEVFLFIVCKNTSAQSSHGLIYI